MGKYCGSFLATKVPVSENKAIEAIIYALVMSHGEVMGHAFHFHQS